MRTSLSLRSSLTLAAFCAAVGSPVAAQSAVAGNVRAVVTASSDVTPRTVAVYTFGVSRSAGVPSQLTVLDSAGTYLATFRLPGSSVIHEMAVDAIQGDLYLQGVTPSGVLTVVLYPNDTEAAGAVIGRWQVGSGEGELLRRGKR